MQGLFLKGARPKTKTAVKHAVAAGELDRILIEATSLFGNEYDGPLTEAPDGEYHFVGPNPYSDRRFYGTITKRGDKVTVK